MSDAPETEAVAVEPVGLEGILTPEQAEERKAKGLPVYEGIERAPDANPFSLDENHEFASPAPASEEESKLRIAPDAPPIPDEVFRTEHPIFEKIPAMPGTPDSIFRHCPCIGVMPGRACPRCAGTKWVKTCPKCEGAMFRTVQTRRGAHPRTERCGFCMGLGQVPARLSEVREAEEAAKAYTPAPATGKPVYARGPQLPGVRQNGFAARAAKKGAGLPAKRRGIRGRQRSA